MPTPTTSLITRIRVGSTAALGAALLCWLPALGQAQGASAPVPAVAHSASASASAVGGPAVAPCPACPSPLTATEVRAVVAAASAVEAAARNLNRDDSSFWANVGTNIFSNRLDAWIFGGGTENQGLVALLAAWFTLVAAVIKLALAWNLPGGNAGPPSKPRRIVEVALSLVLCLSGALAVLAVHTARSSSAAAAAPGIDLQSALLACQGDLQSAAGRQAGAGLGDAASLEALKRIETACVAQGTETRTQLAQLQTDVTEVRGSQVGFVTKLLIFLGFCGVAALVWRSFFR